MARAAKCRICGATLSTDTAYKLTGPNGKNAYYCSFEEYEAEEIRKQKAQADKDKVYKLICELLGATDIINSCLFKEWVEWNKVADDERIACYLQQNKDYLTRIMTKANGTAYGRIRYLSAVIKNNITNFKEQKANIQVKPKIIIDETIYEAPLHSLNKRRSLVDLEDEI